MFASDPFSDTYIVFPGALVKSGIPVNPKELVVTLSALKFCT